MASDDGLYGGVLIHSLVLDIGSNQVLLGPGGDIQPCSQFSPIYSSSKPISKRAKTTNGKHSNLNLNPALSTPSDIISTSVSKSLVTDLDIFDVQLEESLHKVYFTKSESKTNLEKTPILVSVPSFCDNTYKKKLTNYFFEEKNIPAIHFKRTCALNAFSMGKTTALVVDVGLEQSSCCPVVDGFQIFSSTIETSIGGRFFNQEIMNLIQKKNPSLSSNNYIPHSSNKSIKPSESYINYNKYKLAEDIKTDPRIQETFIEGNENNKVIEYLLKDNKTKIEIEAIEVQKILNTIFESCESSEGVLFNGIQNMTVNSINNSDVEVKKELWNGLVLCGGSCKINGFRERYEEEIDNLVSNLSSAIKAKVSKNENIEELENCSWIGGSILSSLGTFQQMWVAKKEYEECGEVALERKCY